MKIIEIILFECLDNSMLFQGWPFLHLQGPLLVIELIFNYSYDKYDVISLLYHK